MKKRLKLKSFVMPSLYLVAVFTLVLSIFFVTKNLEKEEQPENLEYVSEEIIPQEDIPVVNVESTIIRPYSDTSVKVAKYFYDYQGDQEKQKNSIIYHENTYMQNSGVDYQLDTTFDVLAVLDGTVVEVKEDELLGKIVQIRHDNELISVYQSLSEINVKKDDKVKQGQVIGKSGTCELGKELNNHLHFELYHNGQVIDPETSFDKKISELQ